MFTKTVFEGDTVNLEIRIDTSHYNYTAPIIWRHNGECILSHVDQQPVPDVHTSGAALKDFMRIYPLSV